MTPPGPTNLQTEPRTTPELREAHAHLYALGRSLGLVHLDACRSVSECLDAVRQASSALEPGRWLRLIGARPAGWTDQRWPTLDELDRACAGAPGSPPRACVILSFDHHEAMASSAALAAAGLAPGVRVPPAGVVCVDDTGRLTGRLLEDAAYRAWDAAPEDPPELRRVHLRAALDHLAGAGYHEVHDLHSQPWLGPELAALERAGELPLRVVLYAPIARLRQDAASAPAWRSDRLRLGGGKLFADGTLNSRTALMLDPYVEPVPDYPAGRALVTPAQVEAALREAEDLGLHLAVHAIGDGAVRLVLDAAEAIGARPGHRIEHAELVHPDDVPRFARLGVICSVQPCHLLADVEALHRYLPHALDRVLPLRDLIASGCRPGQGLVFGSDAPIVRCDPGDSIRAAVYRRREGEPPSSAINPAQAIDEATAWACFGAEPWQ